ncbi:hypothetical protein Kfla_2833 [Kribbella flavida DSM 17836]|uniref:Uncharacterized protein n=1 Tax=Kribbella flavida (strain DSM 17836 / JCM 10339 / NBRC 14399) TaxID=479435 RepID=D2Q0A6_KRIFD|nr:hypothetical protein [Kribbella flavida]ADB31898.1 hypothetical protein Kfla_2833 [Kribbella flavida DSM 17836]
MTRDPRLDTLRTNDPAATAAPSLDDRAEADLQRIVGTPVGSLGEVRRPAPVRRSRRRLAVAVAAGGALVAGVAVAVPLVGGGETASPAYAVTDAGDGKITFTIYRTEDADGLERRLAQAGVRAEVVYFPRGMRCERTPQGIGFDGHWSLTDNWDGQRSHGMSYTLKPADFKDATLVIQDLDLNAPPPPQADPGRVAGSSMGFLRTGTFGPCVLTPLR